METIGGALCLDFLNTVGSFFLTPRADTLVDYPALLRFSKENGALDAGEARSLEKEAQRRPMDAQATLARAVALREAIFELFLAASHDKPLPPAALATVNEALGTLAGQALVCDGGGKRCRLECAPRVTLDAMLGPIARSAAELLASEDVDRVRVCEASVGKSCTFMFLDRTKNRSRRWCSMKDCGNRAKARRHYQRSKSG